LPLARNKWLLTRTKWLLLARKLLLAREVCHQFHLPAMRSNPTPCSLPKRGDHLPKSLKKSPNPPRLDQARMTGREPFWRRTR
jgi:hypothetical protein